MNLKGLKRYRTAKYASPDGTTRKPASVREYDVYLDTSLDRPDIDQGVGQECPATGRYLSWGQCPAV